MSMIAVAEVSNAATMANENENVRGNTIIEKSLSSPSNEEDKENCVVCFKNVDIYSIGECDHPVCYECSTRMRVLCDRNECPICRHVLNKVIFTYDKLPYRELLAARNRSEYYSKRYKVTFYDKDIQQAFFKLLDHPCPQCNCLPYRTLDGLRNHVKREHNLYFCDLCCEHLKIFTHERRCYTKSELNTHRIKGDADNKSHRGHPLCEYCNKRFLDRDELFRHLRREHYFCHFCDADGCNEFYRDYEALADHFRKDHFLCEEDRCATEQFVGAFRTEIDYKAHVSSVHGKNMNKQQAKQTRMLQLEITLGPRGRANDPGGSNSRSRRGNEEEEEQNQRDNITQEVLYQNHRQEIVIDAQNEQDFPSLVASGGSNVTLIRPMPIMNRSAVAGLARTKENFPALGGNGGGSSNLSSNQSKQSTQNQQTISSVFKKAPAKPDNTQPPKTSTNTSNEYRIHVSNRPGQLSIKNTANTKGTNVQTPQKPVGVDFPSLSSTTKSKKLSNRALVEEDLLPSTSQLPLTNVAAKHRPMMDDYVSIANPAHFQKLQMVQKEEAELNARKVAAEQKTKAPNLTTEEFPSLSGGGGLSAGSSRPNASGSTWAKPTTASMERKQREAENRKAKIAPPPLIHKQPANENKSKKQQPPTSNTLQSINENSKEKKSKEKKDKEGKDNSRLANGKVNGNNSENDFPKENLNEKKKKSPSAGEMMNDQAHSLMPPPGFSGKSNVKPPPGFQSNNNITVNSVAKPANNLTFTNSLGESYSIITTHVYTEPSDAKARVQKLDVLFRNALQNQKALQEFCDISKAFRDGHYKATAYFDHCKAALNDKFDILFPEYLALLPDIGKQQALYLEYARHLNTLPNNQQRPLIKLDVCPTCKQVLIAKDTESHLKSHQMREQFPQLGTSANRK